MVSRNPRQADLDFRDDAAAALAHLRESVGSLVGAVAGPARRATDVTRAFGVDAKLGWQLHRIATAGDVFEVAADVPGPSGVRRALASATDRADEGTIERARRAFEAFEEMVERHAGDRRSFEALLARCTGIGSRERIDVANRRALFRANAQLHGVQVRVQFGCAVLGPGTSPGLVNQAMLRGFVDLTWFRPAGSFVLGRWHANTTADDPGVPQRRPLCPEDSERFGGPLIAEYTTDPAPELRTSEIVPGHTVVELLGRGVGLQAAQTYVLGELMEGIGVPPERDLVQDMVAFVRAPSETLLLDLLVHREHFGPVASRTEVLTDMSGEFFLVLDPWRGREHAMRLPISDAEEGPAPAVTHAHTPDVPDYRRMVERACASLGHALDEFELHRFRLQYPPLHTCALTSLVRER